ncbi:hypothetical protein BIV57_20275 [Mangrovactinospora gilvigrisea]|uniref:Lysine N-acyltransferase MbtK n=1 Tax=Mangrovactinospora gilvigrisea TaxID=1428644 RepID=A0A1J7C7S7_9ACTN|nr:hypothetical protein BIV57_20275 [Mangrovactinospora gilvigrisea]
MGARQDHEPEPGTAPSAPSIRSGSLALRPVDRVHDLPLLTAWMNDPDVDAWWNLAGPPSRTDDHLRAQYAAGHVTPCMVLLGGAPSGYAELYRADLDPLATHYPTRPHDLGIHVLLGAGEHRDRGLGTRLLAATADALLAGDPLATRVLAEPDVRNTRSVAAFARAGFVRSATLELPDKTAALMIRNRGAHTP